ncbi:methyl-accepting chemotaxis protein [Limimonas halophila]|uniref:Methyl-accepting chemotaxis protein n=2 Tax=Limimonas halophila TaxID=1082479 RepID=A0A1G7L6C2_9PROT|nr:HAMP domain-containing methyl-accepting chemotaxis protein [Limimonas halophila]SDF44911.1 methyl-accepting chemotaxis protein [Limimonas halophila]
MSEESTAPGARGRAKRARLAPRVIAMLAGITAAVFAVAVGLGVWHLKNLQTSALTKRADLVSQLQRGAVANPLWQYNFEAVQGVLESLKSDPDLQHAVVRKKGGKVVAEVGKPAPEGVGTTTVSQPIVRQQGEETKTIGELQLSLSHARVNARIETTVMWALGGLAVLLALQIAGSYLVLRYFTRPVETMTRAMGRLAEGELELEVPARDRRDEIGRMADAVQVFKENAADKQRLEREQEEQRQQAEAEKRRALNELADTFESSVAEIARRVADGSQTVHQTASEMSERVQRAASDAGEVASSAEQASMNTQTAASSADELSTSISEVTRQITESSVMADEAVSEAQRADGTVRSLNDAAQKIGDAVSLIRDIAEKTNLLALNATIEAARAGEAGKGFAVVADEVKSLANQTAKATEQIAENVEGIQGATGEAVNAIERIGSRVRSINETVTQVASSAEQQNTATSEIARTLASASDGVQTVNSRIEEVRDGTGTTGEMAETVRTSAESLSGEVDTLRHEVDGFLAKVRAA